MDNFDVLLLNLPTTSWYKDKFAESNSMPPLGLMYIATVLKNNDYKVKIIDFAIERFTQEDFINILKQYNPKVIGMSTYNESWDAQKVLSKVIKDILPNTIVFSGGAFSSFCYKDVLEKSNTDFIIRGEGEYPTLQLCNKIIKNEDISLEEIPGIVFVKNKEIYLNSTDRISNLDELPFPDRDLIDISKYTLPFTISTARGCPGNCIFCSSRAFWGKKVKMRSAKSVFNEVMEMNKKYGSHVFYITDDTFTASYQRATDFCNMILNSGIKFIWGCESRADVLNDDLVKKLKEAGCNKIQIGLESADNDILKKLKKFVTIEQIENGISLAHKYGLHISVSYIIGHAFDTKETIEKTFNFVKYVQNEYGAYVMGSVNTPFPGTEQYDKADELGIKIYSNNWNHYRLDNPIISTNYITRDELRSYHKRIVDLHYKNQKPNI